MSVAATASGELSSGRRWALALVATSVTAISYLDRQTFAVLSPRVTLALHLSETQYGALASAFSLAYLAATPLAGLWVGKVGIRRSLLIAFLVWSGVSALHSLAAGFAALFVLRITLGVAEAPGFPGAVLSVHKALPPTSRARGTGILFTGATVGAMVAPPVVTSLSAHFGWRLAFLGSAAAGLCWVPAWIWATRGSREVLEAKDEATPSSWRESLRLLREPPMYSAVALVLAVAPISAFVLLWGPKVLVRNHGLSPEAVGAFLWLPPVLNDAAAVLLGHRLSQKIARWGESVRARDLLLFAGCGTACVALLSFANGPWAATLVLSAALAGVGGIYTLATADAFRRLRPVDLPLASGILPAAQSLAYIVANLLIGASVEHTASFTAASIALACWLIPGFALWWVTQR